MLPVFTAFLLPPPTAAAALAAALLHAHPAPLPHPPAPSSTHPRPTDPHLLPPLSQHPSPAHAHLFPPSRLQIDHALSIPPLPALHAGPPAQPHLVDRQLLPTPHRLSRPMTASILHSVTTSSASNVSIVPLSHPTSSAGPVSAAVHGHGPPLLDTTLVRDRLPALADFAAPEPFAAHKLLYDGLRVPPVTRQPSNTFVRTATVHPSPAPASSHPRHVEPAHDVIQVSFMNTPPSILVSSSGTNYVMSLAHSRPYPNSFSTTLLPSANAAAAEDPDPLADKEHALADEAWQLVNKYFVSPSFNGVDWAAERDTLASASLSSRKATYDALRKSFRKLSDRYTRLLSPREMNDLRRFDVSGVGLLLTTDASGSLVVATDPPADSAAARAGVVRGDILQTIEGESIEGDAAFSVSERMQGPDGSDMHVTFRGKEPVTLRRSFPPATGSSAVKAKVVDAEDGTKLGYIRLSEFRASSREEVGRASQKLVSEGAEWIVLDLRGNGGGVFEGALEIAGLFEGAGIPVARVDGRADSSSDVPGAEETYSSRLVDGERLVPSDVELAVVMDGGSASSSEVLAGGLRDQCRAALVGERSYGKGVIQGVFGLSDGGGVVVTVAEYRTPNGDRIQGVGLTPGVGRRLGGLRRAARAIGIEKVDETTIGVRREQVREAVKMCVVRNGSSS